MLETAEHLSFTAAQPHYALALSYHRQGQLTQALTIYHRLIERISDWPVLQYNYGVALFQTNQYEAAMAAFRNAATMAKDFCEAWYAGGNCLRAMGDLQQAERWFERAISINPRHADALYNLSNLYKDQGAFQKAVHYYQKAVTIQPDHVMAWNNLGLVRMRLGCFEDAQKAFQTALAFSPDQMDARYNLSLACKRRADIDTAIDHCRILLTKVPDHPQALSLMVSLLQQNIQWSELSLYENQLEQITAAQLCGGQCPAESPFLSFTRTADPDRNLAIARAWSREFEKQVISCGYQPIRTRKKTADSDRKITVGYLSEQFRDAATGHLTAGLFENHDRRRFNIIAYSIGKDDHSHYRARIRNGVDQFIDITNLSDVETASRIHQDNVDILVDLIGWMFGHRIGILAQRPAPVQINYLGFPGTMGSSFHDYIIADHIVVPSGHENYYSEKIVRLPFSYQVTDDHPLVATDNPSRLSCGLPEKGVVFCSFNTDYKINTDVFHSWMEILRAVPGSVLWLLIRTGTARRHLIEQAALQGISAKRLIFAEPLPKDRHLARLPLADIALDTWQVNGHTTTSDALWAGVPVITLLGTHFASRVSAGILGAIGLDELVAANGIQYQQFAIFFASHPEALAGLKKRLADNQKKSPLFRTGQFVHFLEQAYLRIWQAFLSGKGAEAITIPAEQTNTTAQIADKFS